MLFDSLAMTVQHLWVTPFAEGELYPAGYYPLEPNPVGIEQWTENNRSLVGKDLVLWHTMGVTHIPRPEDFPVMCVPTWRPVAS
jgi:primary-amine oxidase